MGFELGHGQRLRAGLHGHPEELTSRSGRWLAGALGLSLALLAVEVTAGLLAHSLALLSDAAHLLTDAFAFGLAWFAIVQARRPADFRRTYGYHRVEVLAAMANGGLLVLVVAGIAYEAVRRLVHPEPVLGPIVIGTAALAILVNALLALGLRRGVMSLNERAARLHVAGDLAASLGVLVTGVLIVATGWLYADPLLSLAIGALIAWNAVGIVLETLNILLEGAPRGLDLERVHRDIELMEGVESVHDLHVWSIDSRKLAFSCHAVLAEQALADAEHLIRAVENRLCEHYGIAHTTIQVELCHPCQDTGHGAGQHNHPHVHAVR